MCKSFQHYLWVWNPIPLNQGSYKLSKTPTFCLSAIPDLCLCILLPISSTIYVCWPANTGQHTYPSMPIILPPYLLVYLPIPPSLAFHTIQSALIYQLVCPLIPASLFFHTSQSILHINLSGLPYISVYPLKPLSLPSEQVTSLTSTLHKPHSSFNYKSPSIFSTTAFLLLPSAHIFLPIAPMSSSYR